MKFDQKYAIRSLPDVIGHTNVISELSNRCKDVNLPEVILFSGESGTGKSTLAKITAKIILCKNKTLEGLNCNMCSACVAIDSGTSIVNYHEYNASNITIDVSRQLVDIASKSFAFAKNDIKVFFINELQELSKAPSALKNLLDILERPPKNVYFILVTMDESKIHKSIIRRAVKYKLNPIDVENITRYLQSVCKNEGVTIDTQEKAEALITIAENCGGSIGIALPILERVIYANLWNEKDILKELGVASGKTINTLINLLLENNAEVLSYDLTEDTIHNIIKKLVWIYALSQGVTIDRWKQSQLRGITKTDPQQISHILTGLSKLNNYEYINNDIIQIVLVSLLENK